MTNQEAIEKFKKIKRGNIFLIHQRIEGKEVIEDYSLCDMAISALQAQEAKHSSLTQKALDTISRQAAIDECNKRGAEHIGYAIAHLSSAQPEIIHCKECKYGVQDEDERWYCRGFGCQVGEEDGSGFCADAERRTDGVDS